MKCPYCGHEVEEGYVQSARTIVWSVKKKAVFPSNGFSRADVPVTGMFDAAQRAYLCRSCKKIVIDLEAID